MDEQAHTEVLVDLDEHWHAVVVLTDGGEHVLDDEEQVDERENVGLDHKREHERAEDDRLPEHAGALGETDAILEVDCLY